jgi:hypothetical protein
MTDVSSTHTDAEYQATLSFYVSETQKWIDRMQAEQPEIDRLKEDGRAIRAEIALLRTQTLDILARLEAAV